MGRLRLLAWVAVLLAPVLAGAAPAEQIAWTPCLVAAQDLARTRNVPLLVVVNMDGERGNDWMVSDVYTVPALRTACLKCVATIASLGKHAEVDVGGRRVCSRFGSVSCAEHQATEDVVRREWLKRGPKDDVESPRHIFRAPDGRLLFERVWTIDANELVKLIDRAVAACSPESLAAWDTTAARLARVTDPLPCLRGNAVQDLLGMHDATVDAQVFDLVRKCDSADVAGDVLRAMAADCAPGRAEGIRKLLAAPAAVVRMHAAAAVASLQGKEAFEALHAAFAKEKQAEVRVVMLRALAVCGGETCATRDLLLKTAKSGDLPLRIHAAVALARWAKEDAVVEALRKYPANDKLAEALRAAACWTLGWSGRKELVVEMKSASEERNELLKNAAAAAIARLNDASDDGTYVRLRSWIAPLAVGLPEGNP